MKPIINADEPLNYRFVIVGIEEDYGVRANLGRGGADKAFQAFLQHFCNLQDNRFFPSHSTAILGAVIPTQSIDDDNVETLREATRAADATVQAVVERIRKRRRHSYCHWRWSQQQLRLS